MERFEIEIKELKLKKELQENQEFHESNFEIIAKWPRSFTLFKHNWHLDEKMLRHVLKHYNRKNYEWEFEDLANDPSILTVRIDIISFRLKMIYEEDIDKISRELNLVKEDRLKIMKEINFFNYYHLNKSTYSNSETYWKSFGSPSYSLNPIYDTSIADPTNLYTILRAIGKHSSLSTFQPAGSSDTKSWFFLLLDQPLLSTISKLKSPFDQILMSNGDYYIEVFLSKLTSCDTIPTLVKLNPIHSKIDDSTIPVYYHLIDLGIEDNADYLIYIPRI